MNDVTAVMSDPMRLKIDVEVALEQDNQFKPVQTSFLLNYQVNTALDRMEGALYNVSLGSTSTLFYNFKIIIPGTSPTRLYLKFLLPESINYEGRKTEIFDIEIAGPLGLSCNDVSNETMAHPEFGIYDQHLKQKNVFTTAKLGRAYDINNCKALHCNVLVTRNTRVLDLSFRVKPLDKDLTRRILQKDGVLDFDGFGHARILEKLTTFNFSRIIINPPEPSEIAAWIIIAAAAGGLIILFLFVVCLCKCGFFRRNAKEKLALLKAEVDAEDTELTIQNRYEDTSPQVTPSA
ncbi:unnamed protein product [Allacma fusca]|uniref:Integrin alpha-2 domain-containing protein n=1 Tax=Allacma fusca TaxID=39272 RepID=A0A8J2JNI4_9HEXA|nr:unnamed protein product [Allacma fusca]